jgi:hypothetical protein
LGNLHAQVGRDALEVACLGGLHEGEGAAGASHTGRATDAVHVGFGLVGQVEVDHVAHVGDVETAAGHVRGHEDLRVAAAERGQCALALALRHVSLEGDGFPAVSAEDPGDATGAVLGAREDNRALGRLALEQAVQGGRLLRLGHL